MRVSGCISLIDETLTQTVRKAFERGNLNFHGVGIVIFMQISKNKRTKKRGKEIPKREMRKYLNAR